MSFSRTIIAALSCAAAATAFAGAYKVTAPMPADTDGAMAYLVNYDTGANVDSVPVTDGAAVFKGDIGTPIAARLTVDGSRLSTFVLEPGEITIDLQSRRVTGSPLNERCNAIDDSVAVIATRFRQAVSDEAKEAVYKEYMEFQQRVIADNADNIIGYMYFVQAGYELAPEEFLAALEAYPAFKNYERVQKLIQHNERKAATQPGAKFVDFEITYDGVTKRLSDYVGRGKYVLVDFWASWCGPCIRETAVLKDIYNEYKERGLEVLGVAVWDEPENTLAAIKTHGLPWECILNAQSIPTEIYGISGIPCIILFGPDGTIISRDKQDDELRADVKAAMDAAAN